VVCALVGFDLLGEISLPAAHRKADYVAVAVHARAHGIARVEEIEILILRALEPRTVKIMIKVLSTQEAVVGDTVHSPAAGPGYCVTGVHGAKRSVGPYPTIDGCIVTKEPVRTANDQGFVHAHCNGVNIRVRTGFRGVEVGDDILVFPQEAMRAGVGSDGGAYQIAVVVHSHNGCPRRVWNQEFCDYTVGDFEAVNGAVGELNMGLRTRCGLVKSHDFAGGVDTTDLGL